MVKSKANGNSPPLLSLADLKPNLVYVTVEWEKNNVVTIPILPLSYAQWQNAAIGVTFPTVKTIRVMKDSGLTDVENYNDPDYQRQMNEANATINLRRVAMGLAGGGGIPELDGHTLDEQVEMIRDLHAGIYRVVYDALQSAALRMRPNIFQGGQESLPEDGAEIVPQNGQRPELVAVDSEL